MTRARIGSAALLVRATAAVAVCVAAALVAPGSAVAAPTVEVEPNENVLQMTGPISSDGAIGTLSSLTDVDKFLVQFKPKHHIKMLFSLLNAGTPECPLAPLGGFVRYMITTEAVVPFVQGELAVGAEFVDVVDMTTPGEQDDPIQPMHLTFYAGGEDAVGCSYRFTVTDSGGHATDAIDPTPLPDIPEVPVTEPNNLPEQALGPIAGDTDYLGVIDGEGDVDRLRAWLFPGQQVTVELAATGGAVRASIEDPLKNILLPPLEALPEQVVRGVVVGTPAEALIRVSGDANARWRLRLSPADSVLAAAPAGTPPGKPTKLYKSSVTLRRGVGPGVRYLGQVRSTGGSVCRSGRLVVLRHAGSGFRRFSITRTRADGSFTVTRRHRTGGTVYVAVVEKLAGRKLCRFARSKRIAASPPIRREDR